MLEDVEWGEFKLGAIFDVHTSKKRFDANKITVLNDGKYPYIVRMGTNNGRKGFIKEDVSYLNEGNTISFGQDTATMFYQEKPYFTGDKIKILKSKENCFSNKNAHFFISAMMKSFSSFSWGSSSFNINVIKKQLLTLPVKENGNIDFDFIESFMAELEAERIAELEAYLSVTGLDNYHLTSEEERILDDYKDLEFEGFNVTDVFVVKNSGSILSRDIVEGSGNTPYLCASRENNSVSSYISYDDDYLDKGNCVFIGGKTFVVSYQEYDFYSNDSHNLILYLKDNEKRDRLNQLYLATCIEKSLGHKYSWGDSISNKKIQKDCVSLPSKNNQPDLSSMATLISAVQKQIIRDVVQYSDQKIAEYKHVSKTD